MVSLSNIEIKISHKLIGVSSIFFFLFYKQVNTFYTELRDGQTNVIKSI